MSEEVTGGGSRLWVITSLDTFTQLYVGRGLNVAETSERLIAMATRAVCRDREPVSEQS